MFSSDFDIFARSINTNPFATMPLGQRFPGKSAVWWNMYIDRWFETRSFAECLDRKSTRLNSSHVKISYAVFCLKKKKKEEQTKKTIEQEQQNYTSNMS